MLSPQKTKLVEWLSDGEWHCSTETASMFIRDYRKRLSELNREGYTFSSLPCDGRCKVAHNAQIHMYKLEDKPVEPPKPQRWVTHPKTGERMTVEAYAAL